MEELIDGNYEFASAYSLHFKPIERGVSMIRNWIRENEIYANQYDPTVLINQAFKLYSVEAINVLNYLIFIAKIISNFYKRTDLFNR